MQIEVAQDGALAFHSETGPATSSRELRLRGVPLYATGGGCGTCRSLFAAAQCGPTKLTPGELSERLGGELTEVTREIVDTVVPLLPAGRYLVGLLRAIPLLRLDGVQAMGGFPKPETQTYDWICRRIDRERLCGTIARGDRPAEPLWKFCTEEEVIVSHRAPGAYDWARTTHYMVNGERPRTALSLSIVEGRDWSSKHEHVRLTHFLLDGHHKTMAASHGLRPLQILSFFNLSESELGIQDLTIRTFGEFYRKRPPHWICQGEVWEGRSADGHDE